MHKIYRAAACQSHWYIRRNLGASPSNSYWRLWSQRLNLLSMTSSESKILSPFLQRPPDNGRPGAFARWTDTEVASTASQLSLFVIHNYWDIGRMFFIFIFIKPLLASIRLNCLELSLWSCTNRSRTHAWKNVFLLISKIKAMFNQIVYVLHL